MDFDNPPTDPVAQLKAWLDEAGLIGLRNPRAMTLATVDPDGRPSARAVLLKDLDAAGAVFYTNSRSRKGRDLGGNPHAALLFYWDKQARQLSIEGRVSLVADAEADSYFASRPRGAQIGAWASNQSEPITDRAMLQGRVAQVSEKYDGREVPRPPHWVGYRVSLERIEFWQGQPDRLHDRVLYARGPDGGWTRQRLSP